MKSLNQLVESIIDLRTKGKQITLLAVCPNSVAVLEAAVKAAAVNNMPMLFAATLNQVDRGGGYTGWTPAQFVDQMRQYAKQYSWDGPLYPCLDHGGPWLKDLHTLGGLTFQETMEEVKSSLTACLEAGYQLLHIDPTVDRTLPEEETLSLETVVYRTIELIVHAEAERQRLGVSPVTYEVGTEEVHGGLVDLDHFNDFLAQLKAGLESEGLGHVWPCFVVAQVGTDLHTTYFDSQAAGHLFEIVAPVNSLIKGHYTDWVENPEDYPRSGMGGANVGPEFTAEEYLALQDLTAKEVILCSNRPDLTPSSFMSALERAVVESGRWQKWLQPDERGMSFADLRAERRDWLLQTGARYIWATPQVVTARQKLYENLSAVFPDPNGYVVDRIVKAIDQYIISFNLFDSLSVL
jgi:tagatose-1,6-bisphosphate aldolase non-catalytic subunit AgaZ/GatZ